MSSYDRELHEAKDASRNWICLDTIGLAQCYAIIAVHAHIGIHTDGRPPCCGGEAEDPADSAF